MFVDQENNDYHLSLGSPCIGTGRDADNRGALPLGSTAIEATNSLPGEFALMNNYPNPFNAYTTIGYNLPRPTDVIVEIYDILGRKVETFTNYSQSAGDHAIIWQADNVPSGVYFYKLMAGEFEQTKRMVLLK